MTRRIAHCLLFALAVALVLLPAVAHAQEAAPVPTPTPGPSGPSAGDIAGEVLRGFPDVLRAAIADWFDQWWQHQGPGLLGRAIGLGFGALAEAVWALAGGVLGGVNIFTQLPPAWSYDLAPVAQMRARLEPLGAALMGLALVLGIGWGAAGTLLGRPFGRLLAALPTYLLAAGGLLVASRLMKWWIDFANAASAAVLDPNAGLPGLGDVRGFDHVSALGVVAVVYLIAAGVFFLFRLKLVVMAALLLTVAPLAIAAGAFPFPQAQRFFAWWLTTFVGAVAVQVLQAVCLALGAALLAAPNITGQYDGPAQGTMSALLGMGALVAATTVPGAVLGGLARGGVGAGTVVSTALNAGIMLAGLGAARAGVATVTQVVGAAGAVRGYGTSMGGGHYVGSLLGDGPLLLPAPKD